MERFYRDCLIIHCLLKINCGIRKARWQLSSIQCLCLTTASCRFTWAPLVRSSCTTSVCPLSLANMRAVQPSWGTQWDKTVLSQWWAWKRQFKGVYLLLSTNYMRQSIIIWTSCIHISYSLVQQSSQYYFYYKMCDGLHNIMSYNMSLSWLTCGQSQMMKRTPWWKQWGNVVGQHGVAPLWDTI